jgi:hypothetical protein
VTDYTARIRAKGLDATGVTEAIARKLYDNLGTYTMAIVELRAEKRFDDADGSHGVELVLTQVEPSEDGRLDDHLRNLTKALHTNRVLNSEDQQLQLDTADDISPKVTDVIAAGQDLEGDQDDDHNIEEGLAEYEAEQDAASKVGNPFVTT